MPAAYRQALRQTFGTVLDPHQRPAGTWGVGAWDLYHSHVVVHADPRTGQSADPRANDLANEIRDLDRSIDNLNAQWGPDTMTSRFGDYATEFNAILRRLSAPLDDLAASGDAVLISHSFERSDRMGGTSRYAGYSPSDARRNWRTPVPDGPPVMYTPPQPSQPMGEFFHLAELVYVIDKSGQVGVVAGTKHCLVAVTRAPYLEIA